MVIPCHCLQTIKFQFCMIPLRYSLEIWTDWVKKVEFLKFLINPVFMKTQIKNF